MTPDILDLARAVVASPRWRFGPPQSRKQEPRRTSSGVRWIRAETHGDWLPDLQDPATLGCLLALVREAWSDPGVSAVMALNGEWMVLVAGGKPLLRVGRTVPRHPTEPAAMVAALLTAPKE